MRVGVDVFVETYRSPGTVNSQSQNRKQIDDEVLNQDAGSGAIVIETVIADDFVARFPFLNHRMDPWVCQAARYCQ